VYLVGLTGGIAAGKTAVAARWVELGAIEIDADVLAREAVAAGTDGLREVSNLFGNDVLLADGSLDRAALAAVVFTDPHKREALEAIVHPRVRQLAAEQLNLLPPDSIVVYTVPLLVEADVTLPFDKVVTVEAPEQVRIERLIETRGLTKDQAIARIKNQASPAERANRADVILNSNQSLQLLLKDAESLWKQIVREASEQ
jgi:dephospho-CoA kinase